MAKNNDNETAETLQLKLRIAEKQLLIEQEKTKQKQLEEETKRIQICETEQTKRMKITHEQLSSSSENKDMSLSLSDLHFYNNVVDGNIHLFNIDWALNDNNYFNNNITKHIQRYLDTVSKYEEVHEELIQENFDTLINNLLKTFNDSTSLKYLNTSNSHCLESNDRPDCTFIFKNVNIHINKPCDSLQDFIVCLGELKSPDVVITSKKARGQILQYLQAMLNAQNRQKIYGFLTNFTHITFFYVEKKPNSDGYHYFKSEDLKMFHDSFETSATVEKKTTTRTTNRRSRKIHFDEDTWKIFTTFLIMNIDFYEYTTLNINPLDDLFPNTCYIIKRLGQGLTSKVYLLEKNENNYYNDDNLQYSVIKISRRAEYSSSFLNELKITQQLKQKNIQNKFDLFFQDITDSSPTAY